jgi:hypothetical protein
MSVPLDIRTIRKQRVSTEVPESSLTDESSQPQIVSKQSSSRVNLILAVAEKGLGELEAIDSEIQRAQERMDTLRIERDIVQRMYDIAMEHRPTVNKL